MTDLRNRKPILMLDFDGVCHSYTSGWKGAAVIPDAPVHGLFEFLIAAIEPFEVHIFSSRSNQEGGIEAMRDWLYRWCAEWYVTFPKRIGLNPPPEFDEFAAAERLVEQIQFPPMKPPAFVGIDDRVLTFTGQWPSIEALRNFKPWNQRGV